MLPEFLFENVSWSFSEPIPKSPPDLIVGVIKYYDEVYGEIFQRELLTAKSPFIRLNVTYEYAIQRASGKWDDIDETVRIDGNGTYLTYADILWQLHKAVYENVKDNNHHYFEGLDLSEDEDEEGVPIYKMWLGS